MGMTMTQKILAAHAGLDSVVAGQLIEADLDLVLANDITGPVAIHEVEKLNKKTVFDKDKIALGPGDILATTTYVKNGIVLNILFPSGKDDTACILSYSSAFA